MLNKPYSHAEPSNPVTVTFDYEGHDTFEDIAKAMQSFAEAVHSYARSNRASLRIVDFQSGSLQCHLEANNDAWVGMQVLAQDVDDLKKGRGSVLMPEPARKQLRSVLTHVSSISLNVSGKSYRLDESALPHLDSKGKDDVRRTTQHTGALDKVDLKANSFRIMLPHGQRVTCTPALPYVEHLSQCIKAHSPRLKVFGEGRFGRSDFLPSSIKVSRVEVLRERQSLSDIVVSIRESIEADDLLRRLSSREATLESHFVDFYISEE